MMKGMDQYISMHFKMVERQLGAIVGLHCILLMGALNPDGRNSFAYVCIAVAALQVFILFRALRKTCYSSLFGREAAFFQSVPVPAGTVAVGKIFFSGTLILLTVLPAMVFLTKIIRWNDAANPLALGIGFLRYYGFSATFAPEYNTMLFLQIVSGAFTVLAVMLLLIALTGTNAIGRCSVNLWIISGIMIAGIILMIAVNLLPHLLLPGTAIHSPAVIPAVCLALNLILLAGTSRGSLRLLEKRDQL